MRLRLILWGFIFLLSPDLCQIDLLPDIIGWILIYFSLSPLADIEERAGDAQRSVRWLIPLSALKLILSFFTFKLSTADLLLATFSYSIVELIFVLPFLKNLFMGLDYAAMKSGVTVNADLLNNARWYLYVFFVVKSVLATLPSTVSLFDSNITGNYSASTWFLDFDSLWRIATVFAFFMSVAIFFVMLFLLLPIFKSLIKNDDLNSSFKALYKSRVLDNPVVMLNKSVSSVIFLFSAGVLFFVDFYMDGIDILPTFIGFLLIAIGALLSGKKLLVKSTPLFITSALGFAVSLSAFVYRTVGLIQNKFVMDYAFEKRLLTLPLSTAVVIFTLLVFILLPLTAGRMNTLFTKDKLMDNVTLYIGGGVILAFFAFVLYAYPKYNTTFTLPSIIFTPIFSALFINYLTRLKKQIKTDNKD